MMGVAMIVEGAQLIDTIGYLCHGDNGTERLGGYDSALHRENGELVGLGKLVEVGNL